MIIESLKYSLEANRQISLTLKKTEEEIERTLEKLQESREKLNKTVNKVLQKLSGKIFALDVPERVKKGMKYATC